MLIGPTALTLVQGDAALAAKALNDAAAGSTCSSSRAGCSTARVLSADDVRSIARLPSREMLQGQLVGTIAAPLTGLARGLNALIAGIAIQLQAIVDQGPAASLGRRGARRAARGGGPAEDVRGCGGRAAEPEAGRPSPRPRGPGPSPEPEAAGRAGEPEAPARAGGPRPRPRPSRSPRRSPPSRSPMRHRQNLNETEAASDADTVRR